MNNKYPMSTGELCEYLNKKYKIKRKDKPFFQRYNLEYLLEIGKIERPPMSSNRRVWTKKHVEEIERLLKNYE